MRTQTLTILALAAVAARPTPTMAQDPGPLPASRMQQIAQEPATTPRRPAIQRPPSESDADCDHYVLRPTVPPKSTDKDLRIVKDCLKLVNSALQAAATAAPSAELNRDIIQMRINYKRLKKWIPDRPKEQPSAEWYGAHRAQLEVNQQLPITLRKHDLFATFSAVLVTGASLADASQPDVEEGAAPVAALEQNADDAGQDAQALGIIIWQSRHFGDESIRTFDWSVGGRIGVQPILNLVTATPAEDAPADTPPVVGAVHQNAFVWTVGLQMHKPIRGINSELGWYGSTGSATLASLPKAIDKGQGSFVAFPLDYGRQKTAWMWESGMTFNIFDNPLEQIHAEKGATSPQFQALVAVRRDERFRGSLFDDYENPAGRLLFRLTLDAIRVFDRRQFGEPSRPFTFGFVVEHERSLATSGQRVPSATRFVLRGDINLLKALTGSPLEEEKKEAAAASPLHKWALNLPGSATLPLTAGIKAVTVTLTKLTVSGSSIATTPAPTITVPVEKVALLTIPACAGGTIEFSLAANLLTLTTKGWEKCPGSAEFDVQEGSKE